jgi:arabinan endo-1,5-alpha-L-arabinosidase
MEQSRRWVLQGTVAGLAALAARFSGAQTLAPLNPRLTGDLYPVHDPCIIKAGDHFYLFCTTPRADTPAQIPCYRSADLLHWERAGHVFSEMPAWAKQAVPHTETIWAPDISFFNGQYCLYYACSTFGSNRSVIGLATTPALNAADPAYHWTDRGLVLESQKSDDFNALDPARVIDRDGKHWLAFGSFWTGLKIIQRAGNYYLFASFDFCCRGVDSSYYTVVGRSKDILGPYVDKDGKPMMEGGGTLVLAAQAGDARWRGPGHIAILRDEGNDYIVYHAYDADHNGRPTLRIAPLGWTEDNWPAAFV